MADRRRQDPRHHPFPAELHYDASLRGTRLGLHSVGLHPLESHLVRSVSGRRLWPRVGWWGTPCMLYTATHEFTWLIQGMTHFSRIS